MRVYVINGLVTLFCSIVGAGTVSMVVLAGDMRTYLALSHLCPMEVCKRNADDIVSLSNSHSELKAIVDLGMKQGEERVKSFDNRIWHLEHPGERMPPHRSGYRPMHRHFGALWENRP